MFTCPSSSHSPLPLPPFLWNKPSLLIHTISHPFLIPHQFLIPQVVNVHIQETGQGHVISGSKGGDVLWWDQRYATQAVRSLQVGAQPFFSFLMGTFVVFSLESSESFFFFTRFSCLFVWLLLWFSTLAAYILSRHLFLRHLSAFEKRIHWHRRIFLYNQL